MVAGALSASAAPAAAAPSTQPAGHSLYTNSLKATNGFKFGVGATAETDVVFFQIGKGVGTRTDIEFATYNAEGNVSATSMKASLGARGSIDLEFKPNGKVTRTGPNKGCEQPRKTITKYGAFVGTIRFTGEGGFSRAVKTRAPGRISDYPKAVCNSPVTPLRQYWLNVSKRLGGDDFIQFDAFKNSPGSKVERLTATSRESQGKVDVFRVVELIDEPSNTFTIGAGANSATVKPPAPFSGTATASRPGEFEEFRWTGNLKVDFPGAPNVSLTGGKWFANLIEPNG